MFFEGSEKKVEIILKKGTASLRDLSEHWPNLVRAANATILSKISNKECDAYLLSESSLFVYPRRLVMITCGTTSLVSAVEHFFKLIDPQHVALLMYERKNEYFPQDQPSDFQSDVVRLNKILPGQAHRFGNKKGQYVSLFHFDSGEKTAEHDMTLEILMHGLSPHSRAMFSGLNSKEICAATEIHQIISGFMVDDHVFDPMGYSINAISDHAYYTLHITPEPAFSYASFETNHLFTNELDHTIEKVLKIFQPESFSMVFFENSGMRLYRPKNYRQENKETAEIGGYHIWFRTFVQDEGLGIHHHHDNKGIIHGT